MKNSTDDENIKEKLGSKKEELDKIADDGSEWLDNNYEGSLEDFEGKKKELEALINPAYVWPHGANPGPARCAT